MSSVFLRSPFATRLLVAAGTAVSLTILPAVMHGQTAQPTLEPVAFASSSSTHAAFAGEDIDGSSPISDPSGRIKTVAPQYGGGYGGGRYHRADDSGGNHLAFEVGGGFTAPIGNDTTGGFTSYLGDGNNYPAETYGGNFMGGAGWAFTKNFTLLGEVEWNTNKIPGRTLSAIYNATNAQTNTLQTPGGVFASAGITNIGGNVHTLAINAEPVFYYFNSDKHKYAGYIIGGVGFYHKSTNFTAPVVEESYFGAFVSNQTFNTFTDNAIGYNLGTGVSFKPFGEYSRAKIFAEARYTFVNTPGETPADLAAAAANPNGNSTYHTGTEELIPVTIGLRF